GRRAAAAARDRCAGRRSAAARRHVDAVWRGRSGSADPGCHVSTAAAGTRLGTRPQSADRGAVGGHRPQSDACLRARAHGNRARPDPSGRQAGARGETASVPIVFVAVPDPVGQGLVASVARPGGHATGFANLDFPVGGKWLELLKSIAPGVRRVALLFNPDTSAAGGAGLVKQLEEWARSLSAPHVAGPVWGPDG